MRTLLGRGGPAGRCRAARASQTRPRRRRARPCRPMPVDAGRLAGDRATAAALASSASRDPAAPTPDGHGRPRPPRRRGLAAPVGHGGPADATTARRRGRCRRRPPRDRGQAHAVSTDRRPAGLRLVRLRGDARCLRCSSGGAALGRRRCSNGPSRRRSSSVTCRPVAWSPRPSSRSSRMPSPRTTADSLRSAVAADPYEMLAGELQSGTCKGVTSVETLATMQDGPRSATEIIITGRRPRRVPADLQPRRPRDRQPDRELPMNRVRSFGLGDRLRLEQEPLAPVRASCWCFAVLDRAERRRSRSSPRCSRSCCPAPALAIQLGFALMFGIFQFVGIMWFLSRPRKYTVKPDDPQIGMTLRELPRPARPARARQGHRRHPARRQGVREPRRRDAQGHAPVGLAGHRQDVPRRGHRAEAEPAVHLHRRELAAAACSSGQPADDHEAVPRRPRPGPASTRSPASGAPASCSWTRSTRSA